MNLEGKNENGSYWELSPYTKTGRLAKYPLTIYYRTNHWNDFSDSEKYWGSISYLKNGTIGKAELINWINGKMYSIKLGIVKNELDVKLVETLNKQGIRVTAYKHR
jgi:hypothetical protein